MKKSLLSSLLLAATVTVAAPAFADHDRHDRDYRGDRNDHRDRYASHRTYDDHHRSDDRRHYRDYRDQGHRHGKYYNRYKKAYKHAYRDGYRDGRHYGHRTYYDRHGHVVIRDRDDDWYKWIAGTYLIGQLIHHYHDGRICYDHH